MAIDDRGIVVGITTYPDLPKLDGPENDANEFYEWLVSPNGGDVPPSQVDRIVSSDYQPPKTPAPTRQPGIQDVEQAFSRIQREALSRAGVPKRLGRRLYVYVAGHGAALPFMYDPDRRDAALLMADASQFDASHVMTRIYAVYFLNAGVFDEVAVFMDCCRTPYNRLTPRFPMYIDVNGNLDPTGQRRAFFAFATRWAGTAREKLIDGRTRGIFTAALLRGLKSAGADERGTITSTSLRNYLLNHMRDLLSEAERNDPMHPKAPDIPAPDVDLVFGSVSPPRAVVRVSFPAAAAGQRIQVRGDGFKIVASGDAIAGVALECTLPRGGYLAEIPALALEKTFAVIGDEGSKDVILS